MNEVILPVKDEKYKVGVLNNKSKPEGWPEYMSKRDKDKPTEGVDFAKCLLTEVNQYVSNPYISTRRNKYMIVWAGSEGLLHWVDNIQIQIPPYRILFIGPDRLSHFDKLSVSQDGRVILFSSLFYSRTNRDTFFLQNLSILHFKSPATITTPPIDPKCYYINITQLLDSMVQMEEQSLWEDLAHNIVEQMLIFGLQQSHTEIRNTFKEDEDHIFMLKFKDLIARFYQDQKNVNFYADKLHITAKRLNKAVKQCLSKNAKEVITEWIMEKSRWKLAHSSLNIKEISHLMGFSEENNFSAFFSRNEGMSPTKFRKTYQIRK